MGDHTMQQDTDRRGGLVGRGAFTVLAALTLVGGGAGVAFADEAPADAGHDATQSQSQQDSKASDDQKASDQDGSDQKDSGQKDSDQKGSDEGQGHGDAGTPSAPSAPGTDVLSGLPGVDSLTGLAGTQAASHAADAGQAAGPGAPIVSSILGG